MIRTFERYRASDTGAYLPGGPTSLECGNERYGFRHIVIRHQQDWMQYAAYTGDNWRDLADMAISAALRDPDITRYRPENNAFCFSRDIYLVNNRTGKTVGAMRPNVTIGMTTETVVTAIPKSEHCK